MGTIVTGGLLSAYGALATSLTEWASPPDPSHLAAFLAAHGLGINVVLLLLLVACGVVQYWAGRSKEKVARAVVVYLHRRSFSRDYRLDPDVRVSILVPTWTGKKLRCLHRSDGRPQRSRWSTGVGPNGAYDGMAGYAWCTQSAQVVDGIDTGVQLDEYLAQTHVSRKRYDDLTWPGAAMVVMPITVSMARGPIGVLIIEKRTGYAPDLTRELFDDASLCGEVLEGFL